MRGRGFLLVDAGSSALERSAGAASSPRGAACLGSRWTAVGTGYGWGAGRWDVRIRGWRPAGRRHHDQRRCLRWHRGAAGRSGTSPAAVGVVLNRISELDLGSALPSWAGLVSEPARLFDGGPVSQQGAICLAEPSHAGEEPPGWRPIFGRVGLLNLETPVEIASGAYRRLRIFAGYAGWDAGQLERELELAMWHVVPAVHDDVFDIQPDSLWRRILRRQGGRACVALHVDAERGTQLSAPCRIG